MNNKEVNKFPSEEEFYTNAAKFWTGVPATVDGMLGGFACVSYADIKASDEFLRKLFSMKDKPRHERALDCGAGIGRITKCLLSNHFNQVDLVEQNPAFVEVAQKMLGSNSRVKDFFTCGLQVFTPQKNYYDVIWCQWVLGHLTDGDLLLFLKSCKASLRHNGIIVIKENMSGDEANVFDQQDSSVTRSVHVFLQIFEEAGLKIVRQCKQTNFPKELFSVKMLALRPATSSPIMTKNSPLSTFTSKHAPEKLNAEGLEGPRSKHQLQRII